MLTSLIVPLLHFTTEHPTVINEEVYLVQTYIEHDNIPIVTTPAAVHRLTWVQVVAAVYLTGVAAMLILTFVQVFSLVRMLHGGLRHTDSEGNTIVLLKGDVTPFSIFRYIVMNVQDYEQHSLYILTHEQEHIRLGHTYDLLLLEAMKTFQWFNPFVWFISRDLKAVHEYEADQAVIHQGIDAKSYQQLLVMKVVGNRLQPFTNNLGHGSLKKRIIMMYKKPSSRWLTLKALCAIPVVALTINAFATPTETDPVEDFVATLGTKDVPVFNEPKTGNLTTKAIPSDAAEVHDNTPFAIHPVRDQYGRIIGFSHEGKPASGDFECIDDTPLFLLDGKVVEIPADFINKRKEHLDEDALGQLLHISKEDIASVTVIKDGRATVIFGEKAKNGVISIETKAFQELPSDTCKIEI